MNADAVTPPSRTVFERNPEPESALRGRTRSIWVGPDRFLITIFRHFRSLSLNNRPIFTMMMHGWGMGAFPRRFEEQYHCFSVAHADKAHLEVRTLCALLVAVGAFSTIGRAVRGGARTQVVTH
jgi:hypothetical protein